MRSLFIIVALSALTLSIPYSAFAKNKYSDYALAAIKKLESHRIKLGEFENHYYSHKSNKKKALIILTGVAEPAIKYWPFLEQYKDDYDLYFWDHLNQGQSPDLTIEIDYRKAHIDHFKNYEQTLHHFINKIQSSYKSIDLISHSTGSHIALKLLLKHPGLIHKFVAITPMVDIDMRFIPRWLARLILNGFYKPTDWAPGQSEVNTSANSLTSSEENFQNYESLIKNYFPKQLTTGVTAGWLLAALQSIEELNTIKTNPINTPMFFLTAGEDIVVDSATSAQFCNSLKTCQLIHYKKGKHQLFMETDDIRFDVYKQIKIFLSLN